MGDPVRRQIARGIKPLAGRKANFRMLNLYDMDRMTEQRAGVFLASNRLSCASRLQAP
jgi:NAD(P)H dehydrogenase (quinone)